MISAKIVADSINEFGCRITTMVLTYPRSIHAELMTHRMLSKNAASSRAIPYHKMRSAVINEGFFPHKYQKAHTGMQGSEYFDNDSAKDNDDIIRNMKSRVLQFCDELNEKGVTKQVINRYLEPYQYYRVLVTATEWDNFIGLRAHGDAEIHIAELANEVLDALNGSTPKFLNPGQWHLPFGDSFDLASLDLDAKELNINVTELKIAVAIARCARVSYDNFNGSAHDYVKDYELFTKLFLNQPIHASPSEHVAYSMSTNEFITNVRGELICDLDGDNLIFNVHENQDKLGWCRNFRGWIQYRVMLQDDTILNDTRITKYVPTS